MNNNTNITTTAPNTNTTTSNDNDQVAIWAPCCVVILIIVALLVITIYRNVHRNRENQQNNQSDSNVINQSTTRDSYVSSHLSTTNQSRNFTDFALYDMYNSSTTLNDDTVMYLVDVDAEFNTSNRRRHNSLKHSE